MVSVSVKVGSKGQIVIPKIFRDEFGIDPGSEILIADQEQQLVVSPKKINLADVFEEISRQVKHRCKIESNKWYDEEMKERHGVR